MQSFSIYGDNFEDVMKKNFIFVKFRVVIVKIPTNWIKASTVQSEAILTPVAWHEINARSPAAVSC